MSSGQSNDDLPIDGREKLNHGISNNQAAVALAARPIPNRRRQALRRPFRSGPLANLNEDQLAQLIDGLLSQLPITRDQMPELRDQLHLMLRQSYDYVNEEIPEESSEQQGEPGVRIERRYSRVTQENIQTILGKIRLLTSRQSDLEIERRNAMATRSLAVMNRDKSDVKGNDNDYINLPFVSGHFTVADDFGAFCHQFKGVGAAAVQAVSHARQARDVFRPASIHIINSAGHAANVAGQAIGAASSVVGAAGNVVSGVGQIVEATGHVINGAGQVVEGAGDIVNVVGRAVGGNSGKAVNGAGHIIGGIGQIVGAAGDIVNGAGNIVVSAGEIIGETDQADDDDVPDEIANALAYEISPEYMRLSRRRSSTTVGRRIWNNVNRLGSMVFRSASRLTRSVSHHHESDPFLEINMRSAQQSSSQGASLNGNAARHSFCMVQRPSNPLPNPPNSVVPVLRNSGNNLNVKDYEGIIRRSASPERSKQSSDNSSNSTPPNLSFFDNYEAMVRAPPNRSLEPTPIYQNLAELAAATNGKENLRRRLLSMAHSSRYGLYDPTRPNCTPTSWAKTVFCCDLDREQPSISVENELGRLNYDLHEIEKTIKAYMPRLREDLVFHIEKKGHVSRYVVKVDLENMQMFYQQINRLSRSSNKLDKRSAQMIDVTSMRELRRTGESWWARLRHQPCCRMSLFYGNGFVLKSLKFMPTSDAAFGLIYGSLEAMIRKLSLLPYDQKIEFYLRKEFNKLDFDLSKK